MRRRSCRSRRRFDILILCPPVAGDSSYQREHLRRVSGWNGTVTDRATPADSLSALGVAHPNVRTRAGDGAAALAAGNGHIAGRTGMEIAGGRHRPWRMMILRKRDRTRHGRSCLDADGGNAHAHAPPGASFSASFTYPVTIARKRSARASSFSPPFSSKACPACASANMSG